jgi:hypothetical protein
MSIRSFAVLAPRDESIHTARIEELLPVCIVSYFLYTFKVQVKGRKINVAVDLEEARQRI